MDDVKNFRLEKMEDSKYIRPLRIRYLQDGREKTWDLILSHSGVYIIIYNVTRKKLVFVKQFRPAVYFCVAKNSLEAAVKEGDVMDTVAVPPNLGVTLELCAGIVDKSKPLAEIAREEVKEECGYNVPLEGILPVQNSFASVGTGGEKCHLFYAEVTDEMRVSEGGGLAAEGELIEVAEMTIPEARDFISRKDVITNPSTLYGIMWFLLNKTA